MQWCPGLTLVMAIASFCSSVQEWIWLRQALSRLSPDMAIAIVTAHALNGTAAPQARGDLHENRDENDVLVRLQRKFFWFERVRGRHSGVGTSGA